MPVGVAQVVGEYALQHQLGHALQQPVRTDQADPPRAGLLDQPRGQLLADRIHLRSRRALRLWGLGRRLRHGVSSRVPSAHSVMELHRCIYSPTKSLVFRTYAAAAAQARAYSRNMSGSI
jgi:hypothetical protein